MSTIVDPVAASVTASVPPSRAHTSHSLSRAAHRATGHTSGYGRLLSAPMPSRPVCRLEPLEMVHLQLRHSLSRASLLSSGTSRLSLTHVPSAAVQPGTDRPQTHHQESRLPSRPPPSSTLHAGRRRPWDPPNCSRYLHTGPLRDKEFYMSPEERAAIRRAEDLKRAALAAAKEAHLAATKVQAVHRGRLSRQEYPAQAHGRTSALAASILHKVAKPTCGDRAHEAARRAAEVGAMVGAPAGASSAKATDGLSSFPSSQIVDQLKLILSRDRKRVPSTCFARGTLTAIIGSQRPRSVAPSSSSASRSLTTCSTKCSAPSTSVLPARSLPRWMPFLRHSTSTAAARPSLAR